MGGGSAVNTSQGEAESGAQSTFKTRHVVVDGGHALSLVGSVGATMTMIAGRILGSLVLAAMFIHSLQSVAVSTGCTLFVVLDGCSPLKEEGVGKERDVLKEASCVELGAILGPLSDTTKPSFNTRKLLARKATTAARNRSSSPDFLKWVRYFHARLPVDVRDKIVILQDPLAEADGLVASLYHSLAAVHGEDSVAVWATDRDLCLFLQVRNFVDFCTHKRTFVSRVFGGPDSFVHRGVTLLKGACRLAQSSCVSLVSRERFLHATVAPRTPSGTVTMSPGNAAKVASAFNETYMRHVDGGESPTAYDALLITFVNVIVTEVESGNVSLSKACKSVPTQAELRANAENVFKDALSHSSELVVFFTAAKGSDLATSLRTGTASVQMRPFGGDAVIPTLEDGPAAAELFAVTQGHTVRAPHTVSDFILSPTFEAPWGENNAQDEMPLSEVNRAKLEHALYGSQRAVVPAWKALVAATGTEVGTLRVKFLEAIDRLIAGAPSSLGAAASILVSESNTLRIEGFRPPPTTQQPPSERDYSKMGRNAFGLRKVNLKGKTLSQHAAALPPSVHVPSHVPENAGEVRRIAAEIKLLAVDPDTYYPMPQPQIRERKSQVRSAYSFTYKADVTNLVRDAEVGLRPLADLARQTFNATSVADPAVLARVKNNHGLVSMCARRGVPLREAALVLQVTQHLIFPAEVKKILFRWSACVVVALMAWHPHARHYKRGPEYVAALKYFARMHLNSPLRDLRRAIKKTMDVGTALQNVYASVINTYFGNVLDSAERAAALHRAVVYRLTQRGGRAMAQTPESKKTDELAKNFLANSKPELVSKLNSQTLSPRGPVIDLLSKSNQAVLSQVPAQIVQEVAKTISAQATTAIKITANGGGQPQLRQREKAPLRVCAGGGAPIHATVRRCPILVRNPDGTTRTAMRTETVLCGPALTVGGPKYEFAVKHHMFTKENLGEIIPGEPTRPGKKGPRPAGANGTHAIARRRVELKVVESKREGELSFTALDRGSIRFNCNKRGGFTVAVCHEIAPLRKDVGPTSVMRGVDAGLAIACVAVTENHNVALFVGEAGARDERAVYDVAVVREIARVLRATSAVSVAASEEKIAASELKLVEAKAKATKTFEQLTELNVETAAAMYIAPNLRSAALARGDVLLPMQTSTSNFGGVFTLAMRLRAAMSATPEEATRMLPGILAEVQRKADKVQDVKKHMHFSTAHTLTSGSAVLVDPKLHVATMLRNDNQVRLSNKAKQSAAFLSHGEFSARLELVAFVTGAVVFTGSSENGSTCMCPVCKTHVLITLGEREFVCPSCHATMHRDIKAAAIMPDLMFHSLAFEELAPKDGSAPKALSTEARRKALWKLAWGRDAVAAKKKPAKKKKRVAGDDAPADDAPPAKRQKKVASTASAAPKRGRAAARDVAPPAKRQRTVASVEAARPSARARGTKRALSEVVEAAEVVPAPRKSARLR